MLHALVRPGSTREVWWLHGARNGAEHVFAAEVDALLGLGWPTPGGTSLQRAAADRPAGGGLHASRAGERDVLAALSSRVTRTPTSAGRVRSWRT